jgi:hypothetical protein
MFVDDALSQNSPGRAKYHWDPFAVGVEKIRIGVNIAYIHAGLDLSRQPPDQRLGLVAEVASRSSEKSERKTAQGPSSASDI